MTRIKTLTMKPEEYETEALDKMPDDIASASMMSYADKCFVNGLLRLIRPKNILEIGVNRGGGTCLILNAMQDIPGSRLTSIELEEKTVYFAYPDKKFPVADIAKKYHSDNRSWDLYCGKDSADVIEGLNSTFDFVILDTAHIHPIESLNFLSVLPFLTNDAVIILHDINLQTWQSTIRRDRFVYPFVRHACKILFDTITADKLILQPTPPYPPNIGAFQLSTETKENISDVFSMLFFDWGIFPKNIKQIDSLIKRYYSESNYLIFKKAVAMERTKLFYYKGLSEGTFLEELFVKSKEIISKRRLIFYGAGKGAKQLLIIMKNLGVRLPDEIWDQNADSIQSLQGIPVIPPRINTLDNDTGVLITVKTRKVRNEIIDLFPKSYSSFIGSEILLFISHSQALSIYELVEKYLPGDHFISDIAEFIYDHYDEVL